MFNLTVDTAHTFYVGENGWLVHNTNDSKSALKFLNSFDAAYSSTPKPMTVTSSQLSRAIEMLYKPGGSVGDGFTESGLRIEKKLGLDKLPGVKAGHALKVDEIITLIDKTLSGQGKNKPGYIPPTPEDVAVLRQLRSALDQARSASSLFASKVCP